MKLFIGVLGLLITANLARASYFLDQLMEDEQIEIAYHQNFITLADGVEHTDVFNCSMFVYESGATDKQYVVRLGNLGFGSARPDYADQSALALPFVANFNARGRWTSIATQSQDTEWSIKFKAYLVGLINDNSRFFDKFLKLATVGIELKNDVNERDLKCNGKSMVYEVRPYQYINFQLQLQDDDLQIKRDYDFTVTFNTEPAQLEMAEQTATTSYADGRQEIKYFESRIVQFTPIPYREDLGSFVNKYRGRPRREQGLFLESFERCQGIA